MESTITSITRRTTVHSYKEYEEVVKALTNLGYKIVKTAPQDKHLLITTAEREN